MPLLFSLPDCGCGILYLTARMVLLPYVTCGAETEECVYPDVKNAEHVPKCIRLSLRFSEMGSKVIRVMLCAEEGEPGNEARAHQEH